MCGQDFIVIEQNIDQAAAEVKAALDGMDGWKQVLTFHLSRNHGLMVSFFPAEDAKGFS